MVAVVDHNSLKSAIFREVRKHSPEYELVTDEEMNKLFFHMPDALRLSLRGYMEIKEIFTAYSFKTPATIKNKHRIGMSKMVYPYFIAKSRLVLFSEMDASVINLCGGIEAFLDSCANID